MFSPSGSRSLCRSARPWARLAASLRSHVSDVFVDQRFSELGLDTRILQGVEVAVGKEARLTRVQKLVFARLLSDTRGRESDLLVRAHTGTGKTLAYLVPAVQRLLERDNAGELPAGVCMLILAPTRELALQIVRVAHALLQRTGPSVRASFVLGGFSLQQDIERLRADAPHILVSTPLRLVQHIRDTPNFARALGTVEFFVLDEGDYLLESKFRHQVDYIARCLPTSPRPQSILCSATFNDSVRRFITRSMRADFAAIDVEEKRTSEASDPEQHEVAGNVQQAYMRYQPTDFCSVLLALLAQELHSVDGARKRVLVVFPTIKWLQFFYVLLKHRAGMRGVWALHKELGDDKRRARIAMFSKGAPPLHGVLFATDLAARGVDFDVHSVIQVGAHDNREQYVHRVGRTGRLTSDGRSLLLLHALEEEAVLARLEGLGLREELPPKLGGAPASRGMDAEAMLARLTGWWEDPHLSASGDLFFANAIYYYLSRRDRLRAKPEAIVRTVGGLLRSTGLPAEQGLPAVPASLARKLQAEDELVGVRAATVRERWDVLCAMPSYPGFRSKARSAGSG